VRFEKEDRMQYANDNFALVSLNDAVRMTSLSRSMINRYRAEGKFPVAVTLGERRIAFVRAEVAEWISQRIEERAAA
jgi:prophage regulatory protein